jgi:two-component sensor histidine kinase
VLTAMFAQRMFGGGPWFSEVTTARVVFFAMFAFSAGMIVTMGTMLRRVLREVEDAHAAQERYSREMRHRVRNMLTMIQALASRGPKARSAMDFYKEFSLRIEGLASSSDLLQIGAESDGRLPQLAGQTVAPFDRDGRIRLSGEACKLPADSCIPLIMALHELCSNAIAHGALSNQTGRVDLNWFLGPDGSTLYVIWTEKGGPRVAQPTYCGLGRKLLEAQPGIAAIDLNFDVSGVWCEIRIEGAAAIINTPDRRPTA